MQLKEEIKKLTKNPNLIRNTGLSLVIASIFLFALIFGPVIINELTYILNPPDSNIKVILPGNNNDPLSYPNSYPTSFPLSYGVEDEENETMEFTSKDFAIIIPKIGAKADVISDVNPFDATEYNEALAKGIAHAKGTSPGNRGNSFLFAHSAQNFYEASRKNVHFYLLSHLSNGDDIYVAYKGNIIHYQVIEVSIVERTNLEYLTEYREYDTLTLMTCWPPGTDWKRVMVVAKVVSP
jgi:LPXTG-site transpeptidase (sortase) family protein